MTIIGDFCEIGTYSINIEISLNKIVGFKPEEFDPHYMDYYIYHPTYFEVIGKSSRLERLNIVGLDKFKLDHLREIIKWIEFHMEIILRELHNRIIDLIIWYNNRSLTNDSSVANDSSFASDESLTRDLARITHARLGESAKRFNEFCKELTTRITSLPRNCS